MLTSFVRGLAGVILIAAVAACGGGGGGSGGGGGGGSGGGGGGGSGLTWTQGVFQPASTFINRCAVVRTGNDSQGRPFPDMAGTLQHELFWLRSWTNQTYLWNTEVADQNPAGFSDRVAYFNVLKTNQAAASGKPKDNFHFTMLTADYLAQQTSAPTAGYGAEIRVFTGTPPRDVRVLYTQTGTPAAALLGGTPKLARGTRILSVDGIDLVNGGTSQAQIDTLNNGLFPRTAGENHTFTVRYPDNSERSITLTSASIVETPVNRQTVLTTASGKVGYVLFNTFSPFSSEKALYDTMNVFAAQGVSDVVLDLRYNGGGLLAVASQLSYMVAGNARTAGHNFERLQFNAAAGNTNPVTGGANAPTPFYGTGLGFTVADGTPLPALNLSRVYILTTSSTCSASESVINGLRGIDVDVVLIGATTCGKPYGFYPADNCGQTYFSIQFRGINDKSFGDYPDGFAAQNTLSSPFAVKISGCAVADDFTRELGDPAEAMLAAALNHRAGGTCPTPPSSVGVASVPTAGLSIESTGRSDVAQVLRNNRDMRMPN